MFSSWSFGFVLLIAVAGIVLISANEEENQQATRFNRADRDPYRPLQFGKRDDFRPLQFGKKDANFRPLQFGKRSSSYHPYTIYSTFNDLPAF
uniref:Uncharacterized protein n=1 Tax=Panagrolaimus sp. PS1159 TaxID=55785 RepID=A0AC35FN75_9BILA